jgi:hypothetical protein
MLPKGDEKGIRAKSKGRIFAVKRTEKKTFRLFGQVIGFLSWMKSKFL